MLDAASIRREIQAIRDATAAPFNLNFFCHVPPVVDPSREAAWRRALEPAYVEFGLDIEAVRQAQAASPSTRQRPRSSKPATADRQLPFRAAGA
jgi:nitronate monooxygenase